MLDPDRATVFFFLWHGGAHVHCEPQQGPPGALRANGQGNAATCFLVYFSLLCAKSVQIRRFARIKQNQPSRKQKQQQSLWPWAEETARVELNHNEDFCKQLQSGVILCKLLNEVRPGTLVFLLWRGPYYERTKARSQSRSRTTASSFPRRRTLRTFSMRSRTSLASARWTCSSRPT